MVLLMIKTITKIGNSQGIIFDSALLKLANLKVGDEVNVEVHSGKVITLNKVSSQVEISSLIDGTLDEYSETMKELA